MSPSIVSSTSTKVALSPYMQKVGKLMTLWEMSEHLRLSKAQWEKQQKGRG